MICCQMQNISVIVLRLAQNRAKSASIRGKDCQLANKNSNILPRVFKITSTIWLHIRHVKWSMTSHAEAMRRGGLRRLVTG